MTKLTVKQFSHSHIYMLDVLDKDLTVINEQICGWALELEKGNALSFFDNDYLVFCAGIKKYWEGVGEIWMMCSTEIKKYIRELLYYSDVHLQQIIQKGEYRRLETSIRADWPEAQRFAEQFGFVREGVKRKFGPDGIDHIMYGRLI